MLTNIPRSYIRLITLFLYVSVGIYMAINWLPTAISWFLPFILAYLLVRLVQPAVIFVNRGLHIPRKIATVSCMLLLLGIIGTTLWFVAAQVFAELVALAQNSQQYYMQIHGYIGYIESLSPHFIGLTGYINTLLTNLSLQILSLAANFVITLPDKMIFLLVFVLSLFFLSIDYERVTTSVKLQIPKSKRMRITMLKEYTLTAIFSYIRGMLSIMAIDYIVLVVGLFILKIDYEFFLALLLAFLDILPLIGTGALLIPWSIIMFLEGNISLGIGLLSLWLTVTIIRQLIEPKIMSKALGLYPLATLMAVYIGYKTLGFLGVFLFPITLLVLVYLNRAGVITFWRQT